MNLKEKMERRLKINASGLFPVFCACVILNKEGKSQYVDKKIFSSFLGVFSLVTGLSILSMVMFP